MKRQCLSCHALMTAGRRCPPCERARQRAYDATQRAPGTRQFYASRSWRKVRDEVLAGAIACHHCGRTGVRLLADHLYAVRDHPDAALWRDAIVPACWSCNTKRGRGIPPVRYRQTTFDEHLARRNRS